MIARNLVMLAVAGGLALPALSFAHADADDVKWIRQCVVDNKDEGQTSATVRSYCTCMNNLMSSSETRTITQWEKTHKKEADACGTKAGWVGR